MARSPKKIIEDPVPPIEEDVIELKHISFFHAPLLGSQFTYTLISKQDEIQEACNVFGLDRKKFQKTHAASCSLITNEDNEHLCVVFMPEDLKKTDTVGAIALLTHEITHLKQFILEFMQEDSPSAEFEAYLMQNLIHDLLPKYMEYNLQKDGTILVL